MIIDKDKNRLALFLLITFTLPLLCCLLMKFCSFFQTGYLNLFLYGLEAASPSVAAIVVCHKKKHSSTSSFISEKLFRNISVKYCLIGFIVPAAVLTFGNVLIFFLIQNNLFVSSLSIKKIVIIMWALIAEELGWRGFLQEYLGRKCKELWVPLIIGVIWALWHYHFVIAGTMDIPYLAFAYGCIAESYGYFIITKLTKGNVVPASIWHFSGNLFFNLYHISPNWNGGSIIPYLIVDGVYSVYILAFFIYKKNLKE